MRQVIDFAARRLSVAATAYYHFGQAIMPDGEYDQLAMLIVREWHWLSDYFKDVFESAEAINASGHHIYISNQCYMATLRALREAGVDEDLCAPPWNATATWEGPNGEAVEIMSLGG